MICTIKNGIGKLDGEFKGLAENAVLKFPTAIKFDVKIALAIENTLMSFKVEKGSTEFTIPLGFEIDTSKMSIKSNADLSCTVEIV